MTYLCTISLVHKYGVTHSHVWRDSFICVTWLIHVWQDPFICLWRDVCDVTHCETGYGSFICVTWPFYICDRPHLYVCHDTFPYVAWLIHAWHDSLICMTWLFCVVSFIRVTWLVQMWDLTHSYAWRDSSVRVTWLIHTCGVTHFHMWHVWHKMYVWHNLFICVPRPCGVTYSYVWHGFSSACMAAQPVWYKMYVWYNLFICVPHPIHTCDMTHTRAKYGVPRWSRGDGWVMSHMTTASESCHTFFVHTCDMTHSKSHMIRSYVWHDSVTQDSLAPVTHTWSEWVMPRHVTLAFVSCIHVTWLTHSGLTRSCHTYLERVTWLTHMGLTHMGLTRSCHTYLERVSRVTSCHIMSHSRLSRAYVWHQAHCDALICVTRLIHMCEMKWLIHMCDMTHSYVWHDLYIRVMWLTHSDHMCDMTCRALAMCDMTHSHGTHSLLSHIAGASESCHVTSHSLLSCAYVRHDSLTRDSLACHTCQ